MANTSVVTISLQVHIHPTIYHSYSKPPCSRNKSSLQLTVIFTWHMYVVGTLLIDSRGVFSVFWLRWGGVGAGTSLSSISLTRCYIDEGRLHVHILSMLRYMVFSCACTYLIQATVHDLLLHVRLHLKKSRTYVKVSILAGTQCTDRSWCSLEYQWVHVHLHASEKKMVILFFRHQLFSWCVNGPGDNQLEP